MGKKKGQLKEKVGFSINKDTNEKLDKYCEDNLINKSKLINHLIQNFLDKKEENIYGI